MNRSRVKGYGFSWANTVNNLTYTSPFWMLALILLNLVPRIKALSTNIDIGKTSFASSFIGTMATTKVFKSVNATKVVHDNLVSNLNSFHFFWMGTLIFYQFFDRVKCLAIIVYCHISVFL